MDDLLDSLNIEDLDLDSSKDDKETNKNKEMNKEKSKNNVK